jgi:ATP-dependent 26S proteasome regulatory subunit
MGFNQDFTDYVLSGHAILGVTTHEKGRAIRQIHEIAEQIERNVLVWSVATGWTRNNEPIDTPPPEGALPEEGVQQIVSMDENTLFVFKDFAPYLQHATYNKWDIVVSWLDSVKQYLSNAGQTIVMVGASLDVPEPLRHDVTQIEFTLPEKDMVLDRIKFVCNGVVDAEGKPVEIADEHVDRIADACSGMTDQQVVDRVALALRRHKGLDNGALDTIMHEKAEIIRQSGILEYVDPPEGGLDNVGGYEALKKHVGLDIPCFTDEAREFGIEFPKGIMMVGIPGCGKTLLSLAIASELKLPLVSMDVGALMSKYVGDSEGNMREALQVLERIAPCVLQLDEIEKGFGGNGDLDGGTSRRVFGTFLKWLSDRSAPVYVVATANEVQSLPPEFTRKGRFDEIFGLDLPDENERRTIFEIHLRKRGRQPELVGINELVNMSSGYTGADIEQAIKAALKIAFAAGHELTTKDLVDGVDSIVPLSRTEPQRIKSIQEWCKSRAKAANPHVKQSTGRKVKI